MKPHSAPLPITIEQIAARAREIWQRNGAPPGRDLEYWLQAENELVFEREQAAQATERMERAHTSSLPPSPPGAEGRASPPQTAGGKRRH
jgi:hypothetical protein